MIGAKLGAGRQADVHAWGDDAVVKLYRPGFDGYEAEAAALSALDGHGIAPRLIEVTESGTRTGLVLEHVNRPDMLTMLQRQPWRVATLARAMAAAHLKVHSEPAPGDLPELRDTLAGRISDAATVLPERLRTFALRVLDALPDGDRLCFGDLHPGNVLTSSEGVSVIDWPAAARGVAEADFARTMLLLWQASTLPGTPLTFRALMAVGRSLFTGAYARVYRHHAPGRLTNVESWMLVQAAARLSEGITTEQPGSPHTSSVPTPCGDRRTQLLLR